MSLTDILYDAVERVSGAQLAGVVSLDGLSVEMVLVDDELPYDEEDAEVELSGLIAGAANAVARLGSGLLHDIIIESDYVTYLLSLVTPGYYAVLGVDADSHLGRARFAVHQMVVRLQDEL
jgi:predicted regulator of Ras-like GTPase activity (Roadblock/LC7/MglB family)